MELSVLAPIRMVPNAMRLSDLVELCGNLASLGIRHVVFNMPDAHNIEPLEIFGEEIFPNLADLWCFLMANVYNESLGTGA
jgi:hypothetical protein